MTYLLPKNLKGLTVTNMKLKGSSDVFGHILNHSFIVITIFITNFEFERVNSCAIFYLLKLHLFEFQGSIYMELTMILVYIHKCILT
jgi:hypothetical protein